MYGPNKKSLKWLKKKQKRPRQIRDYETNPNDPLHSEPVTISEKMIVDALTAVRDLQLPEEEEAKIFERIEKEKFKKKDEYGQKLSSSSDDEAPIKPPRASMAKHLRLSHKNFDVIGNLGHMENLVQLELTNNLITKIEGLGNLDNLKHLDLSYNCIHRIENLDKLRKLETLIITNNRIKIIDNMENNLRLKILNFAANEIDDLPSIKYCRQFLRLRSIVFKSNPISRSLDYRLFTIAMIPQVFMIDYRLVTNSEKKQARKMFRDLIRRLEESEDQKRRRASVVEAEIELKEREKEAFVNLFAEDVLWNELFKNDPKGEALLEIIDDKGNIESTFRAAFNTVSKMISMKGFRLFQRRKNEFKAFEAGRTEAVLELRNDVAGMFDSFFDWAFHEIRDMKRCADLLHGVEMRTVMFEGFEVPLDQVNVQACLNDLALHFIEVTHSIWYEVMTKEMTLDEIIEEHVELAKIRSKKHLVKFEEWIPQEFERLRLLEDKLNRSLHEALMNRNMIKKNVDLQQYHKSLAMDRAQLLDHIQKSHMYRIGVINTKESQFLTKIKRSNLRDIHHIRLQEVHRNRMRVAELSYFADWQMRRLNLRGILPYVTAYIPAVRGKQRIEQFYEEGVDVQKSKKIEYLEYDGEGGFNWIKAENIHRNLEDEEEDLKQESEESLGEESVGEVRLPSLTKPIADSDEEDLMEEYGGEYEEEEEEQEIPSIDDDIDFNWFDWWISDDIEPSFPQETEWNGEANWVERKPELRPLAKDICWKSFDFPFSLKRIDTHVRKGKKKRFEFKFSICEGEKGDLIDHLLWRLGDINEEVYSDKEYDGEGRNDIFTLRDDDDNDDKKNWSTEHNTLMMQMIAEDARQDAAMRKKIAKRLKAERSVIEKIEKKLKKRSKKTLMEDEEKEKKAQEKESRMVKKMEAMNKEDQEIFEKKMKARERREKKAVKKKEKEEKKKAG